MLYVANVDEASAATGNALSARVEVMARAEGAGCVVISAAIEAEIAQLPDDEEHEFLDSLGLKEPGLDRLIRAGYALLGLNTYFTAGPKEARAWTIPAGTRAPQAAAVIHTDFEKGFIRAQTIAYDDFVGLGGEQASKGSRQGARRGQGLRRQGRRRAALQVQRVRLDLAGRTIRSIVTVTALNSRAPDRRRSRDWGGSRHHDAGRCFGVLIPGMGSVLSISLGAERRT